MWFWLGLRPRGNSTATPTSPCNCELWTVTHLFLGIQFLICVMSAMISVEGNCVKRWHKAEVTGGRWCSCNCHVNTLSMYQWNPCQGIGGYWVYLCEELGGQEREPIRGREGGKEEEEKERKKKWSDKKRERSRCILFMLLLHVNIIPPLLFY